MRGSGAELTHYLTLSDPPPHPPQIYGAASDSGGLASRIDLSPARRPVVSSDPSSLVCSGLLLRVANSLPTVGLIVCWGQMPEPEWMNLVKCGFGAYERRLVPLCSSCSLVLVDYCELSAVCRCCSRSAGKTATRDKAAIQGGPMLGQKQRCLILF